MFIDPTQGADASNVPPAGNSASPPDHDNSEVVRLLMFGTPIGLQAYISHLHMRGVAEPNDWSRPLATGRPGEMMSILTKRVHPRMM